MTRLPAVLGTDDLPLAELCAARLDGELVVIARGWVPIDEPDLPSLRALAIGGAPDGPIIERISAAWVLGAVLEVPRVAQFCVPNAARIAERHEPGRVVREVGIAEDDLVRVGGCRCTSPLRTAFDLARDPTTDDRAAIAAIRGFLASGELGADALRRRLEASARLPHKRLARARIDAALSPASDAQDSWDQPSLTRYTS